MGRIRSSDQIEALERQQKELAEKLKTAKSSARAAEREMRNESAKVAGLAFLDELVENPNGEPARLLLALLDRRLTRKADRARFGIFEAPALGKDGGDSSASVDAVAGE